MATLAPTQAAVYTPAFDAAAIDPPGADPMYIAYSFLTIVAFLVASPYFLYQAIRHRKHIGSFAQRLGYLPGSFNRERRDSVWVHAVSVGEVLSARPLLAELGRRHPDLRLVLSTTTITGQHAAKLHYPDVAVCYFPFDLPWVVNRTLDIVRPRLFLMVETEIWPNVLEACRQRGVHTCLVNGRISARSFPRYRLIRPMFRRVLGNIDRCCVQDEESARRLIELGAEPTRVTVTGSLKFDSVESPDTAASATVRDGVLRYFRVPERRSVIMAASTRRGEEEPVLRAFARVRTTSPRSLLIVAPRHPERFGEVAQQAERMGFSVARRSELQIDAEPRADVVILDSIGELSRLYRVATVVFVGGSLIDWGGHNILEPAVFGKPIVFGPYMQNFTEIAEAFVAHDAAWQVRSPGELEDALLRLLTDPVRRASLGAAAKALVESSRGAIQKTLGVIDQLLPASDPADAAGRLRRIQ